MTEWQPIETAPKDGTKILVKSPQGVFTAYWFVNTHGVDGWAAYYPQGKYRTFWMVDETAPTHWTERSQANRSLLTGPTCS